MNGYIDLHAHILPGIDDGSPDLATSLMLLQRAEEAGIGVIAATPHFYPDLREEHHFAERRQQAFDSLLEAYSGPITLLPGAEVFFCEGLQNYPALDGLCISGSRLLLIEMPPPPWPPRFEETLLALREEHDIQVLLAHIERYPARDMYRLLELGFPGQVNAAGLLHPLYRRSLRRLIDAGLVLAIGSDAHLSPRSFNDYHRAAVSLGQACGQLQAAMKELLQL